MRSKLAALLAGLALLAAAGCSGGDGGGAGGGAAPSGDPRAAVEAAYEKTVAADTFKMDFSAKVTAEGQELIVEGSGAVDQRQKAGSFEMKVPNPSGGGESVAIPMVFAGKSVYMDASALGQGQLPGNKRWIKFDLQQLSSSPFGQGFQAGDPAKALQYLKGVTDDVTVVGTETVRGTETVHYRATIDFNKVAKELPVEQRKELEAKIEQLKLDKLPMDLWVDNDSRLRKSQFTIDLPEQRGTMTMTQELYDFGAKVKVTVPPADQVIDGNQFLPGQGQGSG